ncbi:MED14-domain-containing protein [Coniochaeta ligniaria NRRL 30616]|uniref:Mediator of RNA polymerase II transcription subunit 14 n=1 Tax=Coniochaeta ligniaria NRRL 30616 TaxID=1408157 RepID=A0A1J7J453_9PEZI|nr:MED14-domain-containing protein [Coniochaeta ligniaria NRRL 30616]
MGDLPDEIQHITAQSMPLGLLLSRLAQISHNHLQELIAELATRPVAQNSAVNGAPDYRTTTAEDTSPESLEKKRLLLEFIQNLHTRWVKALVITEWSRKAEPVGRLIDVKNYIEQQLAHFTQQAYAIADVKKQLIFARLPSPDLKTALEVLSSGDVSWMPEFGYIEPPPQTPDEQLHWMENLNTLLSVRLTLDEYEKIPYHFRNYSIGSGRVTFKVEGEFEVDLTIADEDSEKQFWFIDFRFLFNPAPDELSERLRLFLEDKVNEALATDGLTGCYKFLHGFTLTHQITEFTRQALELSRTRWVDSLKIERLNRAMSVQYWQSRPQIGLKSWIILGTHSGKKPQDDPSATSRLFLRWFRDNKEVKDLDISLDSSNISAERILKTVIARHVEYILSSIHSKLLTFPRFSKREASLRLTISKDEPAASQLVMRLSRDNELTVKIDPVTGTFALSPSTRVITQGERQLNTNGKDPVAEGHIILEKTRCFHTMEELTRRGKSMGWHTHSPGVKPDELKPFLTIRDSFQALWLRRSGWKSDWSVLVIMSLGGDKWWLVQTSETPEGVRRIKSFTSINITGQPRPTEEFFHNLNIFATGMISQIIDLKVLEERGIKHVERSQSNHALPAQIRLPAVYVRLSEIVPGLTQRSGSTKGWAVDYVKITFKGAQQSANGSPGTQPGDAGQSRVGAGSIKAVSDATITVADKAKFKDLKGNVDSDVTFNTRLGEFVLHLRQEIGTSLIDTLTSRLQAIGRLMDFIDAMRKSGGGIVCESVTMREIVFSYGDDLLGQSDPGTQQHPRWMARLNLTSGPNIKISLDKGNPHLRLLDLLEALANSENLRDLPNHLKLTFSMLKALEGIEDSWAKIAENNDGGVDIHHWSLDYTTITYLLPGIDPKQPRELALGLKHAYRAGQDYWYLEYQTKHGVTVYPHSEFTTILKPIFDSRGEDWKGLGTGAAGQVGKGIELLLSVVNNAVLSLVGSPPPPPLPQQQQQQQHNPSQSFGESAVSTTTKMSRQSSQQRPSQSATQPSSQSQQQGGGGVSRPGTKPTSAIVLD